MTGSGRWGGIGMKITALVGKKWSCHYVDQIPGVDCRPLRVHYHCDAEEEVVTAAGTFRCLRIWKTAQLEIPGRVFMDQVTLSWYSPEVGYYVRRLDNGTRIDLESFHRQTGSGSVE